MDGLARMPRKRRRTEAVTGPYAPAVVESAAAWRLAVVIRVVGDVRRAGDGPDRAAS
jgi:hypothetical protein